MQVLHKIRVILALHRKNINLLLGQLYAIYVAMSANASQFRHSDTFSGCIGWPKARRSPGKDSRSANRLGAGPA
jgi:hypothetical protein